MSIPSECVEETRDWLIRIDQQFGQAETSFEKESDNRCIYRIPKCLRTNDDKAYTPQIVSLGPYHHGKEGLADMDRHKWRALVKVVRRYDKPKEVYFDAVREMEADARSFYEGPIELNSNKFVEMMVLDACFVLEILRGSVAGFTPEYSRYDPVFVMGGAMHFIQRDMLMLENQIPLLILEMLSKLQTKEGEVERLARKFFRSLIPTQTPHLSDDHQGVHFLYVLGCRLARKFFRWLIPPTHTPQLTDDHHKAANVHFLAVFRCSLLGIQDDTSCTEEKRERMKKSRLQPIRSVTDLKDAGIKIKSKKTHKFWDITFHKGILEIPRLLIEDGTECVFLNLIAYEQLHADCLNKITLYAIFMDNLIDSQDDVKYLRRHGVIQNWMGSDKEPADLFNRLCKEVVSEKKDEDLYKIFANVNKYCESRCRVWTASFKHTYFRNPWTAFSLFAAFVLLLLTSAQTFYTIYAYYTPFP